MTLDEIIETKIKIKNGIAEINDRLSELKKQEEDIDALLMQKMDDSGLARAANEHASVSLAKEIVPQVTDWDSLYSHIKTTGDFSLLQRRPSATAYRETQKLGLAIPGVEPREIRKIHFRKL